MSGLTRYQMTHSRLYCLCIYCQSMCLTAHKGNIQYTSDKENTYHMIIIEALIMFVFKQQIMFFFIIHEIESGYNF